MFVPHLHFCGDCEEATAVYEKAFNTKADVIIRDDNGGIVHAEMRIHGMRVMLNNRFGNKDKTTDCSIAAVITFDTADALLECYEKLKQGSTTIDPLGGTSYTELGVQFLDKFGVQWAFMVEKMKADAR
jgi:PhnB protein